MKNSPPQMLDRVLKMLLVLAVNFRYFLNVFIPFLIPLNSEFEVATLTVTLILRKWKLSAYSEWLSIGTRLINAKFAKQIENHFFGKARPVFPKNNTPHWSYLWTWFGVCQKPKSNLLKDWILYKATKS